MIAFYFVLLYSFFFDVSYRPLFFFFFFFNDTATTEIYTLSLHDALPISAAAANAAMPVFGAGRVREIWLSITRCPHLARSEEHTSELQSRLHLVCRLLLEKKKTTNASSQTRRPGSYVVHRINVLVHHAHL